MTKDELIRKIEQMLTSVTKGEKVTDLIPLEDVPDEMQSLAEIFNKFAVDLAECQDFVDAINEGDLEAEPPSRANYMSGPIKELHSQLLSLSLNIKELNEGKMVSKLYYPGELYTNYNELITMVSGLMEGKEQPENNNVSSWKYHQVLSAVNQLTTMVVQYDDTGRLVFANMTAKNKLNDVEVLPYTDKPRPNDLLSYLGKFTSIIKRLKPHDLFGSRFPVTAEVHDRKTDIWYSIHTDVARLTDGRIGVIHMIDDISEWKYNEEELRTAASLDPLTSAYTRKVGDKRFQDMIDQRHVSDNCVGFVDLDGLKQINDNYGHTEGDFAIKAVASILMSTIRDTDWVVRYGGDEFLILFKDCTEPGAAKIIARMYDQLNDINNSINKPYEIQFSAGLTHIDKDMDNIQMIVDIVDEKMYKNKIKRKKAYGYKAVE